MTIPTTTLAAPGKPGRGISGALKKNPKLVLGAGAIAIVTAVALLSKKSDQAGADGAETTATTGQINPSNGGYYDSTANDVYNSLMGQFQTLQAQVAQLTPGASTPTPTPTVPKPATPKPKAVETAAEATARRHAAYLKTPAGIARAKVNADRIAFDRRHAAYLKSPAGIAKSKAIAEKLAFDRRHAAYLKTPAGKLRAAQNAARK